MDCTLAREYKNVRARTDGKRLRGPIKDEMLHVSKRRTKLSRHIINPTKKALPLPYDYPQAPPTQPTDAATTSAASRYS